MLLLHLFAAHSSVAAASALWDLWCLQSCHVNRPSPQMLSMLTCLDCHAVYCLQSFDSVPDSELPVSRQSGQAYSSSSPPPLGPLYSGTAGGPQGPLAAGLAAVQIPQGDSSAGSSPYYTPQQGGPQGQGPLTVSLQQQQLQQQLQMQHQQQQHQHQQALLQHGVPLQQQRRTASIELPSAAAVNGAVQNHGQRGLRTSRSPGVSTSPSVSHQQISLDVAGAQQHSGS